MAAMLSCCLSCAWLEMAPAEAAQHAPTASMPCCMRACGLNLLAQDKVHRLALNRRHRGCHAVQDGCCHAQLLLGVRNLQRRHMYKEGVPFLLAVLLLALLQGFVVDPVADKQARVLRDSYLLSLCVPCCCCTWHTFY